MFVLLDLLLVSVSHLLRQVDGVNRTLQTLLRYVVDSLNDLSTDGLDLGSLTLTNEPWLQRHFFPLNHEFKCFFLKPSAIPGKDAIPCDDFERRLEIPQAMPKSQQKCSNRKHLFLLHG